MAHFSITTNVEGQMEILGVYESMHINTYDIPKMGVRTLNKEVFWTNFWQRCRTIHSSMCIYMHLSHTCLWGYLPVSHDHACITYSSWPSCIRFKPPLLLETKCQHNYWVNSSLKVSYITNNSNNGEKEVIRRRDVQLEESEKKRMCFTCHK